MNRIDAIFESLRGRGQKALMPFVTAGDPDLPTTAALLGAIESGGGSICELGIPFSDPIADGPVIQASMTRALDGGVRLGQIFDMVASVRGSLSMGLVAMVSYSIVHRIGVDGFCRDAAKAGFDGLIVPDLPLEESGAMGKAVQGHGLTCSYLIAPTTSIERAEQLAKASSGFVYVVSRAGITGEQRELPSELPERIERLRGVTDLPIAVGFGISGATQVRQVCAVADAAIVGSALVRRVNDAIGEGDASSVIGSGGLSESHRGEVAKCVRDFVTELAGGLLAESESEVGAE